MPAWQAYNPLLRYGTFAGSVVLPDPEYASLDMLHPLITNASMWVFNGGHGHWQRVSLGEGVRRTRLMYLLENTGAGSPTSTECDKLLAHWNGLGAEYHDDYLKPKYSGNPVVLADLKKRVLNENKSQKELRKIKGYHDLPVFVHPVHDIVDGANAVLHLMNLPGGATGVFDFTYQFGQITEDNLPTSRILQAIRAVKRLAEKGGDVFRAYATLLRVSREAIDEAIGVNRRLSRQQFDANDVTEAAFANKLMGYMQYLRTDRRPDVDVAIIAAGNVPAAPGLAPRRGLPPGYQQPHLAAFLGALPNGPFEKIEALAPHLERTHMSDPVNVGKLLQIITDKHAQYKDNVGLSRAFGSKAAKFLAAVGFKADEVLDAPLLQIDESHLEAASKLALTNKEQETNQHYQGSDADWSKARSLAGRPSRTVAFGDILDQDEQDAATITLPRTGDKNDGRYLPIDFSRFRALRDLLVGLPVDETYVLMEFFRLPVDVPTFEHFDNLGIKLFAASADRICKELVTYSLIALRSNGETLFTMMQPIRAAATARGVGGITDTTIATGSGCGGGFPPSRVRLWPAMGLPRLRQGDDVRLQRGRGPRLGCQLD